MSVTGIPLAASPPHPASLVPTPTATAPLVAISVMCWCEYDTLRRRSNTAAMLGAMLNPILGEDSRRDGRRRPIRLITGGGAVGRVARRWTAWCAMCTEGARRRGLRE